MIYHAAHSSRRSHTPPCDCLADARARNLHSLVGSPCFEQLGKLSLHSNRGGFRKFKDVGSLQIGKSSRGTVLLPKPLQESVHIKWSS